MTQSQSELLFARAQHLIPGGVNSPVRAFRSVGGVPRFIERGQGAYLWDADDNRYIDYVLSWGPLVMGHAHPQVVAALQDALTRGTSYGAPTRLENELAELVIDLTHSKSRLRFMPAVEDDPQQRQPDITKARDSLGWRPTVSLRAGLARTIAFFQAALSESPLAEVART